MRSKTVQDAIKQQRADLMAGMSWEEAHLRYARRTSSAIDVLYGPSLEASYFIDMTSQPDQVH